MIEPDDTSGAEPRPRRGETPWSRLAGDVVAVAELAVSRKAQRRAEQERRTCRHRTHISAHAPF